MDVHAEECEKHTHIHTHRYTRWVEKNADYDDDDDDGLESARVTTGFFRVIAGGYKKWWGCKDVRNVLLLNGGRGSIKIICEYVAVKTKTRGLDGSRGTTFIISFVFNQTKR